MLTWYHTFSQSLLRWLCYFKFMSIRYHNVKLVPHIWTLIQFHIKLIMISLIGTTSSFRSMSSWYNMTVCQSDYAMLIWHHNLFQVLSNWYHIKHLRYVRLIPHYKSTLYCNDFVMSCWYQNLLQVYVNLVPHVNYIK